MAWSVDRLGRSLKDLIDFLKELHALKIDLFLHQQGLDTTTPSGKAMFQMMGVFAEFERAMIQERVRAGLVRAKAEGKKFGRPRIDSATEKEIRKALKQGDLGMRKIAVEFGVGTGTVQRIAQEIDREIQRSEPERPGDTSGKRFLGLSKCYPTDSPDRPLDEHRVRSSGNLVASNLD
jgi:DNA invertase Pin-like site-specific DNA recombinase